MDQGRFSQPARPGTRRTIFCLVSLLLLLAWAAEADAATKRRRGLIMLGRLSHNITLSYDLTNSASSNGNADNSATSHRFDERYSLRFPYAIYSPRLLRGHVKLDLDMNQSFFSSSRGDDSSRYDTELHYEIDGVILQKRPYPVHFSAFSRQDRLSYSFAPTATLKSTGYGVSSGLANRYLPVSVSFSHNENSSERGGVASTSSTGDTLRLALGHSLGISATSLGLSWEETTVTGGGGIPGTDTRQLVLDITNVLASKKNDRQERRLVSTYHLDQDRGTRPRFVRHLREDLSWGLGRALRLRGSYSNRLDDTLDNNIRTDGVSLSLGHTLYQNLRTTLSGHWSKTTYNEGDSDSNGGSLRLSYSKKLRDNSSLNVNYSYSLTNSDQSFNRPSILLTREETVPATTDLFFPIDIEGTDIIYDTPADIRVSDVVTGEIYQPDLHYTVRLEPDRAVVEVQAILLGETRNLRITYRQRVNRDISYTSTSHSANATLSRGGGVWLYTLGGSTTSSEQTSGADAIGVTADVTTLMASIAHRNELGRFGGTYRRIDRGGSVSNSFAAQWSTNAVSRYGNFSVSVADLFSTSSSERGDSRWMNTLSAYGSLSRPLYRRINMKAYGRYQARLDDEGLGNTLSLGVNLSTAFRKNRIMLDALSSWHSYGSYLSRSTSIHLTYSRYF